MAKHEVAKRWSSARMATVDHEPVLEYAKNIQVGIDKGYGLILTGPPGVGKSWSLAALTYAYRREAERFPDKYPSRDYVYITAPEFFDLIPVVGESQDEYRGRPYIDTFSKIPWLVINDLGKEYRGGKLDEQIPMKLGRILRARCENMLPTHITTNLDAGGLKATYGESIMSILREMCTMHVVGGADRRTTLRAVTGGRRSA